MTQFAIETLSVILLVFALYHMPPTMIGERRSGRWRDATVAVAGGALMTMLVLLALDVQIAPSIADYYMEHSAHDAHGRNVVNVILVDFRGVDTMGEISVLGIAATGVYALLRLRSRDEEEAES
jgi:multicomponent Na+:H+ antiporter subunit A